jgi:hypothetical protein
MRTTHTAATTSDASGAAMNSKEEPRDHVMNEPVKAATDPAETLVYFQSWRIHPIEIKIDYTPKEVVIDELYVCLVNGQWHIVLLLLL